MMHRLIPVWLAQLRKTWACSPIGSDKASKTQPTRERLVVVILRSMLRRKAKRCLLTERQLKSFSNLNNSLQWRKWLTTKEMSLWMTFRSRERHKHPSTTQTPKATTNMQCLERPWWWVRNSDWFSICPRLLQTYLNIYSLVTLQLRLILNLKRPGKPTKTKRQVVSLKSLTSCSATWVFSRLSAYARYARAPTKWQLLTYKDAQLKRAISMSQSGLTIGWQRLHSLKLQTSSRGTTLPHQSSRMSLKRFKPGWQNNLSTKSYSTRSWSTSNALRTQSRIQCSLKSRRSSFSTYSKPSPLCYRRSGTVRAWTTLQLACSATSRMRS